MHILFWDNIQPFFKYGPQTRKIMYTTNAIESLNNCYKRLNKGRRVFPTVQALEKSMYLSTKIIIEKWTSSYPNWSVTLAELNIYFPDRVIIDKKKARFKPAKTQISAGLKIIP